MREGLTTQVSWRHEPAVNRAYVWLSDGVVVGYRDLDTGIDHVFAADRVALHHHAIEDWLIQYGIPCARIGPTRAPDLAPTGRSLIARWKRRRWVQTDKARQAAWREWHADRPAWRIPIDPPNGGWHDLVRNDAAKALWEQVAVSTPSSFFDRAGHRDARAWRTGARGEEVFAQELWRLARSTDSQWRYVHSVPVGSRGADIDHVLVGPTGVFTINTKSHRGSNIWVAGDTFMVNGHRQRYVHNSRHEAQRATRLLTAACGEPIAARPLIVVIDPREFTVRSSSSDVEVTTRIRFARWLNKQPHVYSNEQVERVFAAIRRSDTWMAAKPAPQ